MVTVVVGVVADAVVFHVQDTGVGFAPAVRDRLFERFYRVDSSRSRALGGSGIGLTIAKALVEAMDGQIWAKSDRPRKGSCFSFGPPYSR